MAVAVVVHAGHAAESWVPLCEREATKAVQLQDLKRWREDALLDAQKAGYHRESAAGRTSLKDLEVGWFPI